MVGRSLGWCMALGMVGLAVIAATAPGPTSRLYGIRQDDAGGRAWVRAAGVRDAGLAGILGVSLARGDDAAAALTMGATAAIAVTDAANVLSHGMARPVLQLAIHASGILGGLGGAALLARGR
jgi:hypothetical protein